MKDVSPLSIFLRLVYAGIVVLFLGLSFAYLFNDKQESWIQFKLPRIFWISSFIVIGISILFIRLLHLFVEEKHNAIRRHVLYIFLLAVSFVLCQWVGWSSMYRQGITLADTPSSGFVYVLTGLHVLHIAVGIILLVFAGRRIFINTKDAVACLLFFSDPIRKERLQLLAQYWHTIDFLWIYLFLLFLFMHA